MPVPADEVFVCKEFEDNYLIFEPGYLSTPKDVMVSVYISKNYCDTICLSKKDIPRMIKLLQDCLEEAKNG